ncbi:Rha family transcriptional regulator [Oleidesulfovibrio alaskensis]
MTTSLKVAEVFGKNHKHVMEAITNLDCPTSFIESNFRLNEYDVKVGFGIKKAPMYLMTRDGFTFLAMGFNGARAAEFKIKYIEALECSADFRKPNFGLSSYSVPNNRLPYPMHLMTSTVSLSSQWALPFLSFRFSFPLILPINPAEDSTQIAAYCLSYFASKTRFASSIGDPS